MSKEPMDSNALLAAALEKLSVAVAQKDATAPELLKQILEDNRRAMDAAEQRHRDEEALTVAKSNITHPDVSAFNPEGEREFPRPQFVAREVRQCGIEPDRMQLTRTEIELINRLVERPGVGRVTKADGTRIQFTVKAEQNDNGGWERLEFSYPCRNEHRNNHAPLTNYIREYLGEPDERTQLLQTIAELKTQLGQPVGA